MPGFVSIVGQLWMVFVSLLTVAAYILGFLLLVYLLRIARWFVREHDVPRLFAKGKKAGQPPKGGQE